MPALAYRAGNIRLVGHRLLYHSEFIFVYHRVDVFQTVPQKARRKRRIDMKPPTKQHLLSFAALAIFAVLAAGSDDSSSSKQQSSPSTETTPTHSVKEEVLAQATLDFRCTKDDMLLTCNFKVHNPSEYSFKDYEITCTHYGPSGTKIDSNTRTIYEIVPAKSTRLKSGFDMGFIHSQATKSSCQLTDLVVIGEP
jgi:hypothetical protein